MSIANPVSYLTVDQYLKREERASRKSEYVDGRIFAMSGVTLRHNKIATNILAALSPHVESSGCDIYISDVKLRVLATNSFYYPDVMVARGPQDETSVFVNNPRLVVEVLSPSTAATDRREKVIAYKQVPSISEYLIVHQSRPKLELHRKTADGTWILLELGLRDDLTLESLPATVSLPVSEVYKNVEWKKDWTVSEETAEAELYDSECAQDDDALDW